MTPDPAPITARQRPQGPVAKLVLDKSVVSPATRGGEDSNPLKNSELQESNGRAGAPQTSPAVSDLQQERHEMSSNGSDGDALSQGSVAEVDIEVDLDEQD